MNPLSTLLADRKRINQFSGLLLVLFGLVALVALISYHGTDRSWFFRSEAGAGPTRNWLGLVGATLGEALLQTLGAAAFLFAVLVIAIGLDRLLDWKRGALAKVAGFLAMLFGIVVLLDLAFRPIALRGGAPLPPGGFVGDRLAAGLVALVNVAGAWLIAASVVAAATVLSARASFVRAFAISSRAARHGYDRAREQLTSFLEQRRNRLRVRRPQTPVRLAPTEPGAARAAEPTPRKSILLKATAASLKPSRPPAAETTDGSAEPRQAKLPMEKGARGYTAPPLDLLAQPEPQTIECEQELLDRARQIEQKLLEFAVGGQVVAVHPGPVVTTFEFKPEAGVKYSKITSMTDDLSLALRAESVRIDRMPGRATVGVEVPNRRQEMIYPRQLIGSERFRKARSKLPLALGKDITGEVFVAELDRMPHLLIAGATGAGKSVGLNGMIVSLLYKARPEDLRFIMIDTKMIELGIYADIPHLLIPVVTDPKQANTALKWAVREMEQRYHKLASVGVRNLSQFNGLLEKEPDRSMPDPRSGEPIPLEKLPYIVIVIDEMADLMMVSSAEVEESIMRLAQMARAVGIHLILATQRPSVDVITGTIKANFPSRIAFRVSQRVDSRTIIDQQGAEHLLGRGDMLFMATGASRVVRLHGGYITESELNRITAWLTKAARPVYDETVLHETDDARPGTNGGERDEMYAVAVRTVLQEGKCSVTLIQRRLQLGYARAARIVDMMEQEGVVSPGEGSKPREILVGPEFLEQLELRP